MPLVEQSARIAAQEASADGLNWTFSPMVDIARDPRWGRVAEGAGEDPYLGSLVAKAMVKGYQGDDLAKNNTIMACVKHFALYGGAEAGRDYNTVDMSLVKMYNEYLPPYHAAFDAGAASAMSSFNEINGVPATANKWLMTDLLRKQWGFKGFVVTDYTAINEMIDLCAALPLASASCDVAVMCNVLYALADGPAALREIYRVLRPGGRLILCDRQPWSTIAPVVKAHYAALRALPSTQRYTRWSRTLLTLPRLGLVALANLSLQKSYRRGECHFYDIDAITTILRATGFDVRDHQSVYAGQCWLLRAERPPVGRNP